MAGTTVCVRCGNFNEDATLVLPRVPVCKECFERVAGRRVSPIGIMWQSPRLRLLMFGAILGAAGLLAWLRPSHLVTFVLGMGGGLLAGMLAAGFLSRIFMGREREDMFKGYVLSRLGFPEGAADALQFALLRKSDPQNVVLGLLVVADGGVVFFGTEEPVVVARQAIVAVRVREPNFFRDAGRLSILDLEIAGADSLRFTVCDGATKADCEAATEALASRLAPRGV